MHNVCIYLVGAGPGDPGLLTLRAQQLLGQADCVIYDYLASPEVMAMVNPAAEQVYVGKKGFEKHIGQDGINSILIDKAREYAQQATEEKPATIVRLKGGDPFVFGRGGEEALALQEAGVPFQIVPGVTSGIAAPAYAGIPVTHRGISTNVTFVTGNEDPTKDDSTIDWLALAALVKSGGTLCLYMGVRNLQRICSQLLDAGVDQSVPIALIEWGTTARQRSVVATLGTVVEVATEHGIQAPAMIVVGQVTQLADTLAWRTRGPLAGKRVLVTRASKQAGRLSSMLEAQGAQPVEVPLISFVEPEDTSVIRQAIEKLSVFDWLVFTSANGVQWFFSALEQFGTGATDARALAGLRIAAIGPATAHELEQFGITADVMPEAYIAESVFEAMQQAGLAQGQKVLIARAEQAREVLPELLGKAGADVTVAPVYKTVVPDQAQVQLQAAFEAGIDAVIFTSSSTAQNFFEALGPQAQQIAQTIEAFSIGPVTTKTLHAAGCTTVHEASEYTIPGVVSALTKYYQSQEG